MTPRGQPNLHGAVDPYAGPGRRHPVGLAAQYYAQRAAAGLIITEATAVSEAANGAYMNTPGIYTDRHQHKWAEIADAVHAEGGRMFMQLWHVGRMAHPEISGVESVGAVGRSPPT